MNPVGRLQHVLRGDEYPAIAAFLASDPDSETYVLRKFNKLTARRLLHLQGELVVLEEKLESLDSEAAKSVDTEIHSFMRSWEAFENIASQGGHASERWELVGEIEVKLMKYRRSGSTRLGSLDKCLRAYADFIQDKAVLLEREIARLKSPDKRVLDALRNHIATGRYRKLNGAEGPMFDDESDLVALKPPSDRDVLSRTLRDHWPDCWSVSMTILQEIMDGS